MRTPATAPVRCSINSSLPLRCEVYRFTALFSHRSKFRTELRPTLSSVATNRGSVAPRPEQRCACAGSLHSQWKTQIGKQMVGILPSPIFPRVSPGSSNHPVPNVGDEFPTERHFRRPGELKEFHISRGKPLRCPRLRVLLHCERTNSYFTRNSLSPPALTH